MAETKKKDNKKVYNALPLGTEISGGQHVYKIVDVLGQGGYGISYRVSAKIVYGNIPVKVDFAVKEYFVKGICEREKDGYMMTYPKGATDDVEESLRDFISEGQRLAKICKGNKNIVHVNEVFRANNTAYFVMEYIDGGSLKELVPARIGLPEQKAVELMLPIIRAVSYIHSEKLLHLDIKPENIVIRKGVDGQQDEPVLIDFGISLHFDANGNLTSKHESAFTSRGYAPMEQYAGITRFAPETDVYALAATMFYVLAGHDPVSAFDVRPGYVEDSLPAGVSEQVVHAISEGMKSQAYERLQTADAFEEALIGSKQSANWSYMFETYIHYNISSFTVYDDGSIGVCYKGQLHIDTEHVLSKIRVAYSLSPDPPQDLIQMYRSELRGTIDGIAEAYKKSLKPLSDSDTRIVMMTIVTYRTFDEAVALMRKYVGQPDVRIIQEQQLMALAIETKDDAKFRILFDGLYCDVETGGGVNEIWETGRIPAPDNKNLTYKIIEIDDPLYYLTACAAKYYCMVKEKMRFFDDVLLCIWPWEVRLFHMENRRVRDLISDIIKKDPLARTMTYPMKKSVQLPKYCEEIGIDISGQMYIVNIVDILGKTYSQLDFAIDIDANMKTAVIFKDKESQAEYKFDFIDLIGKQ